MDVYATTTLPAEIGAMATEAESEGFRFVTRLVAEWAQGENRFDRDGEILFIARDDGRVVGVCGVNVDPYADSAGIARLRHLYVTLSSRRTGINPSWNAAGASAAAALARDQGGGLKPALRYGDKRSMIQSFGSRRR